MGVFLEIHIHIVEVKFIIKVSSKILEFCVALLADNKVRRIHMPAGGTCILIRLLENFELIVLNVQFLEFVLIYLLNGLFVLELRNLLTLGLSEGRRPVIRTGYSS